MKSEPLKTPNNDPQSQNYNADVAWFAAWARGDEKARERFDNEVRPYLLTRIKRRGRQNNMNLQARADQCKELYDDFCGWGYLQNLAKKYRGLSPLKYYLGDRTLTRFLNRKGGNAYEDGRRRKAGERLQERPNNRVRRYEGFCDAKTGELEIAAPNTNQGFDEVDARLDRDAPLVDRPRGDAPLDDDRSLDDEIYRVYRKILQDMSDEERRILVQGGNALRNDRTIKASDAIKTCEREYGIPGFEPIFRGLTRRFSTAFDRYGAETRERLKKRARNPESRILSELLNKIDPNTGKCQNNNDNNR